MKIRLDILLLEKGLASSRQNAQGLIAAGLVLVEGQPATKVSTLVPTDCNIEIKGKNCPYVSRGGLKLEAGLDYFGIDVKGMTCADIGASTGGFTDCLLQRGAVKVFAIDVGYGQLAWKIRQDERVVVMERTNARNLTKESLGETIDLATVDASFISLKILLPPLLPLFREKAAILALIKPQFEVGREHVGKGGVVKDVLLHDAVIEQITAFAGTLGLKAVGVSPSPILGPKGNREFLILLVSAPEAACNSRQEG